MSYLALRNFTFDVLDKIRGKFHFSCHTLATWFFPFSMSISACLRAVTNLSKCCSIWKPLLGSALIFIFPDKPFSCNTWSIRAAPYSKRIQEIIPCLFTHFLNLTVKQQQGLYKYDATSLLTVSNCLLCWCLQ